MIARTAALLLATLSLATTARAEPEDLCARIAALEDEGRLSEYYIAPARDRIEGIHLIDLDGDGTEEEVEVATNGDVYEVEGERLASYPDIRARHFTREILEVDGEFFGITRMKDMLYRVWRFERDPASGELNGFNHICGFDRQWTDTGNCSRGDNMTRLEPTRSNSAERWEDYVRPPFLDEVFSFYLGVRPVGAPLNLDIDNDGEDETVGTVIVHLPSLGEAYVEVPAIMSDNENELIESSFQNARLIQFMTRYALPRAHRYAMPKITFLLPPSGRGEILIESQHVAEPDGQYSPTIPFRRIFRLRGNWPEQVCESEFEWTTLYTDDLQD
ncbi:MAG: hypothetical protein MRY64_05220 [Hyphomonadaceae bacterium]|nr:hypothetical protein [Hyphomonadaceae bacterium]